MKPADIGALTTISDPQLSPNGHHVTYVVTRTDAAANVYRSRIWVAPTDGAGPPRPLTAGEHRDTTPRWSPDGSQIAFTSQRAKDKLGKKRSTLHLLPFNTPGETVQLAEADEQFGDLAFSPDGKWLAMTHRTRGKHYEADETSARPARKIEHLFYSLDGEGFTLDRPRHIYLIATDGSTALRNLTPGQDECSGPSWFPDGSRLAIEINRHRTDFATDIGIVSLDDTATVELLTDGHGAYSYPTVTPDGSAVVVGGRDDAAVYPQNCHLGTLTPGTTASPSWLTSSIDRTWMAFMSDRGAQCRGRKPDLQPRRSRQHSPLPSRARRQQRSAAHHHW